MTKEKKKSPSAGIASFFSVPKHIPEKFLREAAEDRKATPEGSAFVERQAGMSLEEFYYLCSIGKCPLPIHKPLRPGDVEITFIKKLPKKKA